MNATKLQSILALLLVLTRTGKLAANSKVETSEVKVAIVLDHPDENSTELSEVVGRINQTTMLNASGISLRTLPIYVRKTSFREAASQFCSKILQKGVSIVVLHTQSIKYAHLFAELSSHFRLPVVGDAKQDPLLPHKAS